MMIIRTSSLTKRFGGLVAVSNVTLDINAEQIFGVVGPNGAGKSTLFNLISGVERPTNGTIFFKDENITNQSVYAIARKGVIRTFQRSLPFGSMSVLDNVVVGRFAFGRKGLGWVAERWFGLDYDEAEEIAKARELLKLVGLDELRDRPANELAYGNQRRLEIARALISKPDVLMLDEPAAGLSKPEMESLREFLLRLKNAGQTTIIIEHHLPLVMSLCDRIAVLNYGEKIAEGTPQEIGKNQTVIDAYIGKGRGNA
jgi:branched-chain amino acid transport system ATP-binding protein